MNKQQEIDILSHLISIKSVNDHEAAVVNYIESLFKPYEDQGVKIERVSYAPSLQLVKVSACWALAAMKTLSPPVILVNGTRIRLRPRLKTICFMGVVLLT